MFGPLPRLEIIRKGLFRICDRLTFGSQIIEDIVDVQQGFLSDLASFPPGTEIIFDVTDIHWPAAVLHDFFYYRRGVFDGIYRAHRITRKQADQIFLEALKVLGVGFVMRWGMYTAVRAFGWRYWGVIK